MKVVSIIVFLIISLNVYSAPKKGVVIYVSLSPAGSFEGKTSRIKGGKVIKSGDEFSVKNISVVNSTIETGIDLRNEHLQKRLGKENVVVLEAKGKKGEGSGKIKINGVTKDFKFTYTKLEGNYLKGEFKLKLSDFNIKDVKYLSVGVDDEIRIEAIVPFK